MPIFSDDIRRQLNGKLIFMWRDSLRNRPNLSALLQERASRLQVISQGERSAALQREGIEAADSMVDVILSNEDIAARFSKREITKRIEDLLLRIVDSSEDEIAERSRDALQVFENELGEQTVEWTTLLPVANINVLAGRFELGNAVFLHRGDEREFADLARQVLGRDASSDGPFFEDLREMFRTRSIVQVRVMAVDGSRAEELAELEATDAVCALRFLFSTIYRANQLSTPVNDGTWSGELESIHISSRGVGKSLSRAGPLVPLQIRREYANLPLVRQLDLLLKKPESDRSQVEGRLLSALRIMGLALDQKSDRDAFLGLVISLEAFLLEDREPKKEMLAERIALLVGTTGTEKRKIYGRMKKIYDIRSSIVHGSDVEVTDLDLWYLTATAYASIAKGLTMARELHSAGDFFQWFEGQKFPDLEP